MQSEERQPTPEIKRVLPSHQRAPHLEGTVKFTVVAVEDVQHEGLQGIRGDQSMVCAQNPALIVTPCLDLATKAPHRPDQ